jgi:hypothetical protein
MILGRFAPAASAPKQQRVTIDDIFQRHARRRPNATALIDADNRTAFTDGAPRRLDYAQADRVVSAIAARLLQMGLPTDSVVGIQLPNTVENVLALLGVLRAGLIAAPLPLLSRRADLVAALARIGAKALITCGRVGGFNHGQLALTIAADVFSIRYVCGFGAQLPDGMISFDDVFESKELDPAPPPNGERTSDASAHLAAITFDTTAGGLVPVARNHAELLAGGLAVLLESRLAQDACILSTIAPASFSGLCLTLLPWVLCGGTLTLHHPFDAAVLARQSRDDRSGTLILPGPVALRFAAMGGFAIDSPGCVIAAWRAPQLLPMSEAWHEPMISLVDVSVFGEAVLVAASRTGGGKPVSPPFGAVVAPRGSASGVVVAELSRTAAGTLAARGPMVPHHAFPPGIERSGLPHFAIGPGGFVDTRHICRSDPTGTALIVTGPPAELVSIGGYRFPLQDLTEIISRVDPSATLAALPDPLTGQRLIGNTADRSTMQAALGAVGVNPLVAAAFSDRSEQNAERPAQAV